MILADVRRHVEPEPVQPSAHPRNRHPSDRVAARSVTAQVESPEGSFVQVSPAPVVEHVYRVVCAVVASDAQVPMLP